MAWSLVKVTELPLGKRVLSIGSKGRDVQELQELLSRAGFYFGAWDGVFGLLTKEALVLFQKTFNLRIDGIAGPEVIKALKKTPYRSGRIVYTLKKHENLDTVSKKFAVKESAWKVLPGQGDRSLKAYPGLKVLLYEKALLDWEESGTSSGSGITALITPDYMINGSGELIRQSEVITQGLFHLIGVKSEDWSGLLSSPKAWSGLAKSLTMLNREKVGLDFRTAPVAKIAHWIAFLKFLRLHAKPAAFSFLVLPFLPAVPKLESQLYWLNLATFADFSRILLLEPEYNLDSPQKFESSAIKFLKDIKLLREKGLGDKSYLVCRAGGWVWDLEQNQLRQVTYKEARLIRAWNFRSARYSSGLMFTVLRYTSKKSAHCLIYRDEEGWRDFLNLIIKMNLPGLAIRNFSEFGKAGPEIIAGSFKVLSSRNLE